MGGHWASFFKPISQNTVLNFCTGSNSIRVINLVLLLDLQLIKEWWWMGVHVCMGVHALLPVAGSVALKKSKETGNCKS